MSPRKQLARLLANEQVILPGAVLERIDTLVELLRDRLDDDRPSAGGSITMGMDWSTLEIGVPHGLPDSEWIGGNQRYFEDASQYMRSNPGVQFEFGGTAKTGHWVKRTR